MFVVRGCSLVKMALTYKNPRMMQILRNGIIDHCKNIMDEPKLKIDGLICLSFGAEERTIIVKLDDAVQAPVPSLEQPPSQHEPESESEPEPEPPSQALPKPKPRPFAQKVKIVRSIDADDNVAPDCETEEIPRTPSSPFSKGLKRKITPKKRYKITAVHVIPKRIKIESDQDSSPKPLKTIACDKCHLTFSKFDTFAEHHFQEHAQHACRSCFEVFTLDDYDAHKMECARKACPTPSRNPFHCGICDIRVFRRNQMLAHLRDFHDPHHIFSCMPCNMYYPDLKTFSKHRKDEHSDVNEAYCTDCQLYFARREFTKHKNQCLAPHENQNVTSLPIQPPLVLNEPKASHHDIVQAAAEADTKTAGDTGSASTVAKENVNVSFLDDTNAGVSYSCSSCESVFTEWETFSQHYLVTHQRFACDVCYETFPEKAILAKHHKMDHVQAKFFVCVICAKTYANKYEWKQHIRGQHPKQAIAMLKF
ncbi:hypothetical protein CAPTEDRAFT_221413 [Capitella teleta]|uniref:C2H2-type domain-containing protein n=1 Tax=Capitella teleta TaxID=283909 RepID=R7V2V7_CAPTE|nr:hypothetical protein CAPTEDRAFT_221413 [Capitella teleta]|eukprot:ELU10031.1 hypothetical protein CAPTEDRAFT_221413 [Capitella teleta]